MRSSSRLSKSRFQLGLQCPKALYLKCFRNELADEITEAQQAVFDTGNQVGALARERFHGGVLIEADHTQTRLALEETRAALDSGAPAIFEAAFQHDGVLVRVDVLARVDDAPAGDPADGAPAAFDLIEVKSSTQAKPEYESDVAIQLYVLEGAGLKIRRAHLLHLNKDYIYPGGDYDLETLFATDDMTDKARAWLREVPALLADMKAMLAGSEPDVRIGKRCDKPYTCAFFGHCHAFLPEYPITELPRISDRLFESLMDDCIVCIRDIPAGHPGLTPIQRKVRDVIAAGKPSVVGSVADSFATLRHPIHFVDFETFMPALPIYPGTRPYQQIPFQWSDHVLDDEDGSLEHLEFLFDGETDPRPHFVETLLAAVRGAGSIVVYSSFEKSRLNELARDFPEHAGAIAEAQEKPFDLEKVVKTHLDHPGFHGKTSIKYVLPALVGDRYGDLGVADGTAAMRLYGAIVAGALSGEEKAQVLADLREYCGTDTHGMYELYVALRGM